MTRHNGRIVGGSLELESYAWAVLTLVKKRFREVDRNPASSMDIGRPAEPKRLPKVETAGGVMIPVEDEDWPDRTLAEKALHLLFRSPVYPLVDSWDTWASGDEAVRLVTAEFSERAIPAMRVRWAEMTSDLAQSRIAFAGLGSMHLRRLDASSTASDPDGAAFVVDVRWLGECDVRAGFERLGAAAYFDADRRLVRIAWCHGGRDVRPADPLWEHVKYAWRASLFVAITVADHLWGLHLRSGNEMVAALREDLPAEHPVRLLLKPFTYRTVSVAHRAANILVVERGLPHRAFALTYEGLGAALVRGSELARFQTFEDLLRANGTYDLSDFPYREDGLALFGIIRTYVESHLALYYEDDAAVRADPALATLYRSLEPVRAEARGGSAERRLTRRAELVDLAASFIFYVTGMHEHVGSICEYLLDPRHMGGRVRTGLDMCDVQGTVMHMLIMSGTSIRQPRLLEDYSHLLPHGRRDEARAVLLRFQSDLHVLMAEIDERNEHRAHPFESFNPRHLEVSVSL